jgi:peptidyl-prolyl isomerase D
LISGLYPAGHFSIVMAPAPHLNGSYEIFGELVEGMDIAEKINALARGQPNNTAPPEIAETAKIVDAGQLRQGTIVPNLEL